MQRTAKKCTKIYNSRVHPLFCSLSLLFSDVLVAVAVAGAVCLSSLTSSLAGSRFLFPFKLSAN